MQIRNVGPNAKRRPVFVPMLSTPSALAEARNAPASFSAVGPRLNVTPPPIIRNTFLQPSINAQYPNITWTVQQFKDEFKWMTSAGIHEIILQWTVDQDAGQTYFPYSGSQLPAQYNNMVGNCLTAAAACGVSVWLGLCNTFNWQAHAADNDWLYNQFYLNTVAATQLMTDFPGQFVGWYISNEWSDTLYLDGSSYISASTAFFQDNTSWLHANTGLPVMTSPANYGGQTASAYASNIASVLGTFDVINLQDGSGDVGFTATQIGSYFSALSTALAGAQTQLWHNADLYGYGTGLPITVANLSAILAATQPYVSKYSSFSFETQMNPTTVTAAAGGNYTYYQNYRAYAQPYFDASDTTISPTSALVSTPAGDASASFGIMANAAVAGAGVVASSDKAAISTLPGSAPVALVVQNPSAIVNGIFPSAATMTATAYNPTESGSYFMYAGTAVVSLVANQSTSLFFRADPDRTWDVPYEDRTFLVISEARILFVDYEDRTYLAVE